MSKRRILSALAAGALLSGLAAAQTGAAITVIKVGVDGGNQNDFAYYGQSGGIAAYSMATTSCNPGTDTVIWTSSNHPVIGQNIFRYKNQRFEQLGQSWLKHGFCAVNESGCGSCQATSCATLGIGCADTYWATLNDGAGGGPKWQVNAATGTNVPNHPSPTGPTAIRGRLQVPVVDIDPNTGGNGSAQFFAEAQYISADTCQDGNGSIANSWRRLNVVSVTNIDGGGPTVVNEPGVFAWRNADPQVAIQDVYTGEFAGSGRFTVAYRVTGNGPWTYRYAIQNISSDRSAYSFNLPIADSTAVSDVYFRDVDYHSGEPFSNVDWINEHSGGVFSWHGTETFAQNPNGNAIRWGNMYYFEFTANVSPVMATADVELFKPGAGSDVISFSVQVPGGDPGLGTSFCAGDGSGTFCPCLNFGGLDRGCANGTYPMGARLTGSGTASVSSDTAELSVAQATPSQPGLYFSGTAQANGGLGETFGDGLRCAGGNVIRLETVTSSASGGTSNTSISLSATGGVNAGDTLHYQFWYRDPSGSPCGTGFNTSNGLTVNWTN